MNTVESLRPAAPRVSAAHYDNIRAFVPTERLLEYRVGKDGWEPLCKF
jgi:hypothetical protein